MNEVKKLIAEVKESRKRILDAAASIPKEKGTVKPSPDRWPVAEVLEHLFLAEQGGINFIWRAADGYKKGQHFFEGESPNQGLTIEQIFERT